MIPKHRNTSIEDYHPHRMAGEIANQVQLGMLLEIDNKYCQRTDELDVERPNFPEQPWLHFWAALTNLIQNVISFPNPGYKDTEWKTQKRLTDFSCIGHHEVKERVEIKYDYQGYQANYRTDNQSCPAALNAMMFHTVGHWYFQHGYRRCKRSDGH